jgi:hypothetical protein
MRDLSGERFSSLQLLLESGTAPPHTLWLARQGSSAVEQGTHKSKMLIINDLYWLS